ncbi:glutamine--fructose-6-phosphate transaminase (isomerizing) [Fervidicoccus fontis]|uniref:glutamine--fructose-6-phosphate transaminase (isomerizing) n=1 Tax=Fervidicoccus fontis TaxID=683846 RepID=UPI0039082F78
MFILCGIIGVAIDVNNNCSEFKAAEIITKGLKSLEYRGYDSVGIALIDKNTRKIIVKKGKGKLDDVSKEYSFLLTPGCIGIGHTRWATHGAPTNINAHPHTDCKGDIALVHNGIIKNFLSLKKMLLNSGHTFKSDTDTEVVAHLIEELASTSSNFYEGFKKSISMLEGSFALAVVTTYEPEKIFFAKKESPLIIGLSKSSNFLASDIPAMLEYTNEFVPLNDGDIGWLSPREVFIENLKAGIVEIRKRKILVDWKPEMAKKGGYPHYMIKEIYEQPLALKSTFEGLISDETIIEAADLISKKDKIFIAAAGTSYHAGLVTKYFIEKITGRAVYTFISSEYKNIEYLVDNDTAIIVISQSGETIDTIKAMRSSKNRGGVIFAITNVIGSTIGREANYVVPMRAGPEIGVAATKTFLTQVLVGSMLAVNLGKSIGKINETEYNQMINTLSYSPNIVGSSISMTEGIMKKLPERFSSKNSIYFLGRGLGVPLAYEAALKMKEITYIHAEAYPAGESKHGPIALIEKDFPVFFVVTKDTYEEIASNIAEMNARDAYTIALASEEKLENLQPRLTITVPKVDLLLEPYSLIPPIQLLSYYTAVVRGLDPDKPRNLAKTVTVE